MTSKKRYFLVMLLYLLLPGISAFSSGSLPYSYSVLEILEDGKLFLNIKESEDVRSFFFKPNFYNDSEVLYTWKGLSRKNAKGVVFQHGYILKAEQYEDGIFTVWNSAGNIYAGIIDTSASILSEIKLAEHNTSVMEEVDIKYLNNCFIVRIAYDLFVCTINDMTISKQLVSDNVYDFDINSNGEEDIAYILVKEASGLIYISNLDGKQNFVCRVPVFENVMLDAKKDKIISVTYPTNTRNSILRLIDSKKGIISEFNLEETGNMIEFFPEEKRTTLIYLGRKSANYSLFKSELHNHKDMNNIYTSDLPPYFIEPIQLKIIENSIFILFRNGIASFNTNGTLQSADIFPLGEYFSAPVDINFINDKLIIRSKNTTIILQRSYNSLWMVNSFLETTGKAIIPVISILIIFIFIQLYRHQKRLLSAVLNLPSSGIVFVIDKNGRLTRANASGKRILGITNSIPLGKPFQFYCTLEHTKPINELVQKSLSIKETITQKISIQHSDKESKEWYCTSLPLRNLAGQYRGIVFTGIDITEELERKRLSNWAQLAHDMQTNLSTIKLNAEQLEFDDSDKNFTRRAKILHQTKLMIQRVRDVVTVGRTDLLGMQLVNSMEICTELRLEFDETLFPNIDFTMDCKSFKVYCDKPKIIRALRNAVENAIKAIPEQKGGVIISCKNDQRFAYFSIKDTGEGMDQKIVDKMMTPYFTTAKDKGGYGMGTMIMQHVIELHAGKLIVNTKKGKGTEVIFAFPNYIQKQR